MSLKELRVKAGLSQSQLANEVGISVRTIQDYEQGRSDINGIGLARAKKLADALGCKMEDLLEEE